RQDVLRIHQARFRGDVHQDGRLYREGTHRPQRGEVGDLCQEGPDRIPRDGPHGHQPHHPRRRGLQGRVDEGTDAGEGTLR
ncbi:hypothetical protein DCD76_19030, partial [Acinetobacter baumannii]